MPKVITLPPNYAGNSYTTDVANVGHSNIAYGDTTVHVAPKNSSYTVRNNSSNYTSDSRSGTDISAGGNAYTSNKGNGLVSGRYGTYSSRYIVSVTKDSNMMSTDAGGYIGTATVGGWPRNVNGLVWNWSSSGAHSATKCSYPIRCILLYANSAGTVYRVEANQKVFGQSLGSPGNSQTTDYWTCYQVKQQDAYWIKDNGLLWGGFAFEMYANHGTGSQSLVSTIWNVRPTLYKGGLWDISTSFSSGAARQVMYHKGNALRAITQSQTAKRLETY